MDRWEYMTMATTQPKDGSGEVEIYLTGAPSYEPVFVAADQSQRGSRGIRQLDVLGAEGWQLVEHERQDTEQQAVRVFWLTRRTQA